MAKKKGVGWGGREGVKTQPLKSKRQNDVKISWESCEELHGTVLYLLFQPQRYIFLFVDDVLRTESFTPSIRMCLV